MFSVQIVADIYNKSNGMLIHACEALSGNEFVGYTCPCALDAFEQLSAHISSSRYGAVSWQNIKAVVRRAEPQEWGKGDLAPFDDGAFENIAERLGDVLDENWPGVGVSPAECKALGDALNAALAEWAQAHSIASNAWHAPNAPILELPVIINEQGELDLSDEDRQRLTDLT